LTPVVLGLDLSLTARVAVALPIDWIWGDNIMHWENRAKPHKGSRGQLVRYMAVGTWVQSIVAEVAGVAPGGRSWRKRLRGIYITGRDPILAEIIRLQLFGVWGIIATDVVVSMNHSPRAGAFTAAYYGLEVKRAHAPTVRNSRMKKK
jgi:hypothetical protein